MGRSPSIHASPVACSIIKGLARACKLLRDLGIHGVIWFRITELRTTEEGLEGDEQDWQCDHPGPLSRILENVNGDCTGGGDVWVVDLGDEFHLGRQKGITVREDDVYFEITTFIRTVLWALKGTTEMKWRIAHRLDADICRLISIITKSNFFGYPT